MSAKKPRKAPELGEFAEDDDRPSPPQKAAPKAAAKAAAKPAAKPVETEDYFAGADQPAPVIVDADDLPDDDLPDADLPDDEAAEESTEDAAEVTEVRVPSRKEDGPVVRSLTPAARRVVNLDERKLTGKAKTQLAGWHGKTRQKKLDCFFAGHSKTMRAKFGHSSVFLGSETDNMIIGIPCPSLAYEFVIAQDCFPLGLVLQLVAKHGIGKSGLLAEFFRWADAAGGGSVLAENETKFNPDWYRSIMGHRAYNRMELHRCASVEDWQERLTESIKDLKSRMEGTKKEPGPGRTIPIIFGVDSIMGKQGRETQEQIVGKVGKDGKLGTTGQGHASRSYPIEAQLIAKYARTIPQLFDGWPFALVLVNHLRMKQDDAGNPERSKSGGEQFNFQESFELELSKIGGHKKKIECTEFEGYPVRISCEKNSFGPTHRSIHTRVLWWWADNEETGIPEQKTVWDWDWSTVHLLNAVMHGDKANPQLKANLGEIDFHIDCPKVGEIDNTAWSKSLGMKKDDALPWSHVGAMIREDRALMDRLRLALRINRRPLMAGDYLKQMEAIAETSA